MALREAEHRWHDDAARQEESIPSLLIRAGAVPDRHSLKRVASTVTRRDYQDIVAGTDLELVLDPYMGCFLFCLKAMLEHVGTNQLHVFMEEQEQYKDRVGFYYDEVFRLRKRDRRLVGITFLGKDEAVGFQAADYLAFHIAKHKADPADRKAILTRVLVRQRERRQYARAFLGESFPVMAVQLA